MPDSKTANVQETDSKEEKIDTPEVKGEKQPFKIYDSQDEFDNHSAGIRKNAEAKLLKELGLTSKDELDKFKKAYQDTLTQEEKVQQELKTLQNENLSLKAQLAEQECLVSALAKVSGKSAVEMNKLVRMARGLVSEDTTVEQAIDEVFSLIKKDDTPPPNKAMPKGQEIDQPDKSNGVNPYAEDTWDEDAQRHLRRTDPERAARLRKAAGY